MDIQFDVKCDPVGGHINNYLLEKSRVVSQGKGERSFHIFYQLLAHSASTFKMESDPNKYRYLSQSGCTSVSSINDKQDHAEVLSAMKVLGFSENEITLVMKTVGAVLHLGNINFVASGDVAAIGDKKPLESAAGLLGITSKALEGCLLERTVGNKKDSVKTQLNTEQAAYGRDALGKI